MEEYRYDQADNLIEKRNGKGETLLTFEIGPGNLKKVRRLASGENHYFEYDRRGRYLRVATDDLEVRFAYDSHRNRTQDLRDGRGVRHRFEGKQLVETTFLDAFSTRYRHEPGGALTIRDPGGMEHQVRLLEHGLVVRTLSNGTTEVSQFDGDGGCLLKVSSHPRSGSPAWGRSYVYSAGGDLLRAEDSASGDTHYTYDAAHRLVVGRLPGGQQQVFVYDAADNLLRQPGLERVELRDGQSAGLRQWRSVRVQRPE